MKIKKIILFVMAIYLVCNLLGNKLNQSSPVERIPNLKEIVRLSKKNAETKAKTASKWKEYLQREVKDMENYDVLYYKIFLEIDFENELIFGDNTKTFKWHESYPIATYLVLIAVTNYEIYSIPYSYNDTNMSIDNYLFPEQYDDGVDLFGQTPAVMDFLSTIYCDYPFLEEKYGHAVYPGGGAMEHQTSLTL